MVASAIVPDLVQVQRLIEDSHRCVAGGKAGGRILEIPRRSAVQRSDRRVRPRHHIHNDAVEHVLRGNTHVVATRLEQLVDGAARVGVLGTLKPFSNVAAVAARFGHLVEPDRVVDAVGPKLAVVRLSNPSVHLDVKLVVHLDARQSGVNGRGGQR